jgi:hypothetical protein
MARVLRDITHGSRTSLEDGFVRDPELETTNHHGTYQPPMFTPRSLSVPQLKLTPGGWSRFLLREMSV